MDRKETSEMLTEMCRDVALQELKMVLETTEEWGHRAAKIATLKNTSKEKACLDMVLAFKALIGAQIKQIEEIDIEEHAKNAVLQADAATSTKQ